MIPSPLPAHLNVASETCFQQVKNWLEREAVSAPGPFIVGVGGPGGSGKSTLSRWLRHHMPNTRLLSLDDFRLPRHQRPPHGRFGSHPEANDLAKLQEILLDFRQGKPIRQPIFDAATGKHVDEIERPAPTILLADGEIAAHEIVRPWLNRLVLVEAHWRTQLNVRLTRDVTTRGYPLEKAIDIFLQSNLRDYPRFAVGAHAAAHVLLYCNARRTFSIRRLPK